MIASRDRAKKNKKRIAQLGNDGISMLSKTSAALRFEGPRSWLARLQYGRTRLRDRVLMLGREETMEIRHLATTFFGSGGFDIRHDQKAVQECHATRHAVLEVRN